MQRDQTGSDFDARVRENQRKLTADLAPSYDFIVCGSGSSGSVVARRLAENPAVRVLLLEAGGSDDLPTVTNPSAWPANLGTAWDWGFSSMPNRKLDGRTIAMPMGKLLGGSSSINAMYWSRGHRHDWDFFAAETGDPGWSYESVLNVYRVIEDWRGAPDPLRRGRGGPVHVEPASDPSPLAPAMLEGASGLGIPTFDDQNGRLMEGDGGAAIANLRIREGRRQSIFRSYTYPYMDRANLTVLTGAVVQRVIIEAGRATGVEFAREGRVERVSAVGEVVLSLGAINTPRVLMHSGVGDAGDLERLGIPVRAHLPGVGRNFQDHAAVSSCIWELPEPLAPRNNLIEATLFWKSATELTTPDLQLLQLEFPLVTPEMGRYAPPASSWSLVPVLLRPRSTGQLRLTGSSLDARLEIDANTFADPADARALLRGIELCREIGNSAALRPFSKREVLPGKSDADALTAFLRVATTTCFHQSCTAKMGRDEMSVVNGHLQVYGIDRLRVADASVMPRVTTGNTMAPCVVIGERAAAMLASRYRL